MSQNSGWKEWIRFFVRGVYEQAHDAMARSRRLLELRERFHRLFHEARSSALLLKLIDHLFTSPVITISGAADVLRVTYHSAQDNIDRLVVGGVLKEITKRKRDRIYVSRRFSMPLNVPSRSTDAAVDDGSGAFQPRW